VKLLENAGLIVRFAVLKNSLNDPAAIGMGSKNVHLPPESINDKLQVLCRDTLDGLLNHMVAILIFDALHHIGFELFHELRLLVGKYMFESFLNNSTPVHLHRKFHDVILHVLSNHPLLDLIPMLEKFLDDIVAKNVRH